MTYLKYQDRFEEIEALGNVSMGRFMLREVLTKMVGTCQQCMRDRMRCTLRPLCPDRIFLNILIALGANTSDLPAFCYQVHIRNLKSYLQSGATRLHPLEPRYPLRYFQSLIRKSGESELKLESFAAFLEKETASKVHSYAIEDVWYFGVGKGIFIVNLEHQLVSLDPDGDTVLRPALEPLITFLVQMHGVNAEILKDMDGTWYLRFKCPPMRAALMAKAVNHRVETMKADWAYVNVQSTNQETRILIGLDPAPNKVTRLRTLRETIHLLADIKRDAS
ncbi:MAG: hypothetical protein ACFFCO_05425 [Promethearchaeota archaeon]